MNTPNTTDRLDAAERRLPPSLAAVTAERDDAVRLRFLSDTKRRQERHKLTKERDAALSALARIADMAQQWGNGTDLTGEMGDIARDALKAHTGQHGTGVTE